ncbi:MAG: hypothetical protein LLH30_13660 [Candidatus Manganitrophus sp. SA1]|nr:hypothetical protein [Candidatus Manganitrophus morganii]
MIGVRQESGFGLLSFVLLIFLLPSSAMADSRLLAGAAALEITPVDDQGHLRQEPYEDRNKNGRYDAPDPDRPKQRGEPFTDLNGNGKWDGPFLAGFFHHGPYYTATGVHDPLWARALVLEQGETTLAIVALDVVGLLYPEVVQIRERVADLGLTQVIVAATHTHGGVDTLGLWGPNFSIDGKDPRTMEQIRSRTEEAIRRAWAARRPARLSWGKGRPLSRFGRLINDLRDPVVIDDELRVMRAEALDGKTIATLINGSPHPETVGAGSSLITSDFPHYLRKGIEEGDSPSGGGARRGSAASPFTSAAASEGFSRRFGFRSATRRGNRSRSAPGRKPGGSASSPPGPRWKRSGINLPGRSSGSKFAPKPSLSPSTTPFFAASTKRGSFKGRPIGTENRPGKRGPIC